MNISYLDCLKMFPLKRLPALLFFVLLSHLLRAQDPAVSKSYVQNVPGSAFPVSMAFIPAGRFTLGSPANESGRAQDESPQRKISMSAFWLGAFEITRDQLDAFLKDENTSLNSDVDAITRPSPQYIDFSYGMGKEGGFPANSMSQQGTLMYCRWLYRKTGVFYRLPTEAEWEYACRAGSTTAYYFGNDPAELDKYAWFEKNSEDRFHKVGLKLPNAWGLYDMLGNVMEWTLEQYDPARYQSVEENDPVAAAVKLRYPKALRGGGFTDKADDLRCAKRFHSEPSWNMRDPQIPKSKWWLTDAKSVGFRILRPVPQPKPEEAEIFYTQYLGR